jgi:FMN reductase [NAD(P)H]
MREWHAWRIGGRRFATEQGDGQLSSYAKELQQRFGDDRGPDADGAGDPFIRQVLGRKTVRAYTQTVPPDALLDLLCAAALSASAKSDFQQASILRVVDAGKRARIGELFPAMPWIGAAPAFFVFLGDARRLERIGAMRGKRIANGTLEGFFNAAVDAALTLQTFILAAESAGLGCCPISVLRNKIDQVAEMLALPEKVFPVAGLCVGYPAREGYVSLRLPRTVTLHRDVFEDRALGAAIDDYDRRRDAIHSIAKDQQRSPEEYGVVDVYGWSEDKARQAAKPEGAAFPVYLRKHGFTLD